MQQLRTAIVGATGNVGREMIRLMQDAPFIGENPLFYASEHSAGDEVEFIGEIFTVADVAQADFKDLELVIFATDSITSRQYVPKALAAGAYVIDCSSAYRLDEKARLVVPEVNMDVVKPEVKLYASPDAATIELAIVLQVIEKQVPIKHVTTTVMESISTAGRDAMDELYNQSAALIGGAGAEEMENFHFPTQIAFNVLPQVGGFEANGMTTAEQSLIIETNKLLSGTVPMAVTCVHVPTFVGTAQSVTLELDKPVKAAQLRDMLQGHDMIEVIDEPKEQAYSTPFGAAETDMVYVSRIREDRSRPNSLQLWLVIDNLRKGSALNVLQIAERIADFA